MKELSRKINSYLTDLDNCVDPRHEFKVINELQNFIEETKFCMSHNNKGESYYDLACNEMFNDIGRYLEKYRQNNNLPGKQYYSIRVVPHSKNIKMSFNLKTNNVIKMQALRNAINGFPKYSLMIILGLDSTLGKEYIKFNRYLTKDEFERFLKIRNDDPEYFVPFIQHILYEMNNLKLIKEN
jgi:hypothetical protein